MHIQKWQIIILTEKESKIIWFADGKNPIKKINFI